MSTYFLMAPGYYSFGPSQTRCWQNLRRLSGRTKHEVRKGEYFMFEFAEDGLKFNVNPVNGDWNVNAFPVRLVEHNGQDAKTLRRWASWCREGMARQLARHAGNPIVMKK